MMKADPHVELSVSQKDRISVDIADMREEIEGCRNDASWLELSMAGKIRVLVKERLEQIKSEKESKGQSEQ